MNLHDLITDLLGRLLGLEYTQRIEGYELDFGATWARHAAAWLMLGVIGLAALAVLFYARYQRNRHRGARVVLAVFRAVVLCLLLLLLAEPVLRVTEVGQKRPLLWLLFDGTDSMGIADERPTAEPAALDAAAGGSGPADSATSATPSQRSRMDGVKALVENQDNNLLARLAEKFRLQAFLFDSAQGVRSLELSQGGRRLAPDHLSSQLTTNGKVTAIGGALNDLAQRHAAANLGGVVVFSDFNQNAGPPAVEAAKRLGAEVYTVGVGATRAVDVSATINAGPKVTKEERLPVQVVLRQEGLEGQSVHVTLAAEQLGGLPGVASARIPIGEKMAPLVGTNTIVDFEYEPHKAGHFLLVADVDPVAGEAVTENNRAQREVTVLEDFLRLLFIEYEPTWEWRFVKEVFHRDRLVGVQGFRTFLFSSDPRVRRTNQLFVPTMIPPRNEFFAHDVIFLGDVPATGLSPRFCEMTREFVGQFGGGLVVMAGPRFGLKELAGTPLADMLPVIPDPAARINDRQPFRLKLTPRAAEYQFMQLGATPRETQLAWDTLGLLPWYQPVKRTDSKATVLAEHPTYTCIDGKEKQPLIAIRPYGKGEVVYLGFNETWRLRREHGEKYYRQFWGQMIEHLALSHALGNQKRFVVSTDRRQYQADEQVTLTVDAYSADFQKLRDKDLPEQKLQGELVLPSEGSTPTASVQPLSIALLKEGTFETRFRVYAGGEHRVRVLDPITKKNVECTFHVLATPVERQRPTRNLEMQRTMAAETGGKTYELTNIGSLPDEIRRTRKTERTYHVIPLTSTWLCFGVVVGLLLAEWLLRKRVHLP